MHIVHVVLTVLQFNEIPDDYVTAIQLGYNSISHPLEIFGDEITDPGNRMIIISNRIHIVHVSIDIVILLHVFFSSSNCFISVSQPVQHFTTS